jgi:TatD DNase family protein
MSSKEREAAPPPPEPLPVEVFDSHCHLDILKSPVPEVVAAGRSVGIARVVTVGYDLPSSRWCAEAAATHDGVYGAVAIHPNDAGKATDDVLDEIAELAAQPGVRAVGETGLDYYRDWAEADDQRRSFRAHIDIAKRTGKALVIHDRDAHDDVLRVLAEEGAPERVVFHCFSGDRAMAEVCADRGYVMSFAGNVTFKNAGDLREAAAVAPADLLLVETDAPYLTPQAVRKHRNQPAFVAHTAAFVAELRGVSLAELGALVERNAERVFRW